MLSDNQILIVCDGEDRVVQYAADELRRYLAKATGAEVKIGKCRCNEDGLDIHVGMMADVEGVPVMEVPDPVLDDGISIVMQGGGGYIAGVNPRSVLLAVYRYLTEMGCRWVRPGADGEYIPVVDKLPDVQLDDKPSYRHRGICIEGAVSVEHVCDLVDWMPKLGFNGYFIQFREAHTFFDRWYAHTENPTLEGRHISIDEAKAFTAQVVEEIKKRGLLYHGVGHGWTCEPFGISGLGWDKSEQEIPEETTKYLAQVNGKRELWGGIALNTNLCYGNPEVRRKIIEEIANYSASHPEIDIMHFWLADGTNNHCECDLCKDTLPSDFYVMMLNELDALLTERGLKTRIVFLIYVDLLWPPQKEKIANPDRFILMFAPITRTYSKTFKVEGKLPELQPYKRNQLSFPSSVDENLAYLKAWQDQFNGDSFDFDYHLMWDHFKDPGYLSISEILSEDIKGLRDIGIDGYVSAQSQRVFFPTGLPMTVMGRTLWNRDADYAEIEKDYFQAAFGPNWKTAYDFLCQMSELFDPVYIRGEKGLVNAEAAEMLSKIPALADDYLREIKRNIENENPCWSKSWFYLKHSARICKLLSGALEALARDDAEAKADKWQKTKTYVREHEMKIHPVLDVWCFISTMNWLLGPGKD